MSRASPKAGLSWAPGFRKKWQGRFFQAQEYLDRAVLELSRGGADFEAASRVLYDWARGLIEEYAI